MCHAKNIFRALRADQTWGERGVWRPREGLKGVSIDATHGVTSINTSFTFVFFTGADAVLQCAFTRSDIPDGQFFAEHANVKMAYNVYQTCIEEGVKRVVVISSNHAADYYENLIWSDRMEYVTPEMVPLSDNFYGWAKASYELLGFAFATGNVSCGRQLEVIQLRVGGPRETDIDRVGPDDLKKMHRALGAYLSVRDQVQLVVKSLETQNIDDENEIESVHEIMIEIGVREYIIDFAQMIQFDQQNAMRKRNIRRVLEDKGNLKRSDSLKGCAGKFFEKPLKFWTVFLFLPGFFSV